MMLHTLERQGTPQTRHIFQKYIKWAFKRHVLSFSNPLPPRKEVHSLGLNNLVSYVKLDHSKPGNQGKLLVITLAKASY